MPENVDPLHNLYDFAYKLGEWVFSFVAKHCPTLSEIRKRKSISKFTEEEENDSLSMAHSDPIDITSSDSENESEIRDLNEVSLISSASPTPRKLPSWASNVNAKLNSYNGLSRNLQQSERASSSSERLINHNLPSNFKFQKHPNSIHRDATYNQNVALVGNPNISTTKSANGFHAEHLNDNDYGNFASQLSQKRLLPPSLQPLASTSKAKASMDNEGASIKPKAYVENGYTDIHSKPYPPLGTNGIDHKFHATNNLSGNNSDEIYMYERLGARLLPPSLVHGRPSSSQSAAPIDSTLRPGVEQSPSENDERLIYQAALQNLAQPKDEADLPDGLLAVPLMKHQKIALAWMYLKETTSVHCLGGILADDQGLGKTISMIALILLQRHLQSIATAEDAQKVKTEALNLDDDDEISEVEKAKHTEEPNDVKPIPKVRAALPASHKGRPAAGTLVVCPASVLRQWGRELDDKVTDDHKLSVLIYHGGTRTKDPLELARHDVVLTTYAIVANEVPKHVDDNDDDQNEGDKYGLSSDFSTNKKRKKASNSSKKGKKGRKGLDGSAIDCGTLAKVGWSRVILDEAQTIKNYRTQVSRACCGLRAKRRWCLSGTPIQNTIDDLFSYFRFLKYDPYAVKRSFCANIKLPISKDAAQGYKKLQAVLKTIMLRRTKGTLLDGKPIINIPPKTVCLVKVDFSIEEREFYTKLETDSRAQFKSYAAAGTVNQNYANILLMLLRLRQACDHPFLVNKGHTNEFVGKASVEMARQLTNETLLNLLSLLEDPICSMCSDPPEQAVVTICGHVYCYQCVSEYLTGEDNACPAHDCKAPLGTDVVFAKATLRNCISGDDSDASSSLDIVDQSSALQNMYSSSKIRAALSILEKNANSTQANGPIKTIVFSQWTGMLDLIETSLNRSCIQYRRFDGTMSLALRDKAVKDFNTDLEVTVMLMSLKAGNLGLNMVAACQVILLDLWWNPTTEDQAVDRAHRIGQTRPVTVSRLTITGTVEDRILSLQEEKRKMVASAFGEDPTGGVATRLTVDDLRYLFMI